MSEFNDQRAFKNIYNKIVEQASVRMVIESYGLPVFKKGKDYKTICPFHEDHDPSLSIRSDDKIWKCFACNESGNAISFVLKYENKINNNRLFSIQDAMRKVVEICNLNINLDMIKRNNDNLEFVHNRHVYNEKEKKLLSLLDKIKDIGIYYLQNSDSKAKKYLYDRGFDEQLISQMEFGYIPSQQIYQWIDNNTFSVDELLEIGFIKQVNNSGEFIPAFKDRLLIPILDERGNVVTFSGRSINNEEPKYLHGQNSILFTKSNHLYNYNRAKNSAYGNQIYVVEGFMDVAGGNKIGINNIVATMGTSFSSEQIDMIKRLNCDIVLVRDNDKAGIQAMIKEIPYLINQGFKVSVIDLSKLENKLSLNKDAEYKDLWDFSKLNIREENLEREKTTGFRYLLEYKYFGDKKIDANSISEAYEQAKNDGMIRTSKNEMEFKDYVQDISNYTNQEIDAIIHEKKLDENADPLRHFQNTLMLRYLFSSMDSYISRMADKVKRDYYQSNRNKILKNVSNMFIEEPEKYLDSKHDKIKQSLLFEEVFQMDEQWLKYKTINKFQHDKIFENVHIKNISGQQMDLELNVDQKRMIIKAFNDSMTDEEKLQIKNLEELYIFDRPDALKNIIGLDNYKSENLSLLIESMERSAITKMRGAYIFSYSSVFDEKMLFAIDSKFKTTDGKAFKSILLFDNQGGKLNLTKENIKQTKEQTEKQGSERNPKIHDEKESEKEQKYINFTVHNSLINRELDKSYFVRIPNTQAKKYMYLNKNEVEWTSNEEVLLVHLLADSKKTIYDKAGKKIDEWDTKALLNKWERKNTKNKVELSKNNHISKSENNERKPDSKLKLDIQKYDGEKVEQFTAYTLPKERILGESQEFYNFRSYMNDYELSIPKSDVHFDNNKTMVEIYPKIAVRQSKYVNETLSDIHYGIQKNNGFQLLGQLPFNILDQHLSEKGLNKQILSIVDEHRLTIQDNGFIRIPIFKNGVYGYLKVSNRDLKRLSDQRIALLSTPYHEFKCYKNSGEEMENVFGKDVDLLYKDTQKEYLDIENYEVNQLEMEVSKV